MKLYVVRHGEAAYAPVDSQRKLTAKGAELTHQICRIALKSIPKMLPLTLIVSPFLRANQTAQIIVEYFDPAKLLVSDSLVPSKQPKDIARFLDNVPDLFDREFCSLMLVGHQPLLGKLLEWLTDNSGLGNSVSTSSFTAIELIAFAQGGGTFDWHISE